MREVRKEINDLDLPGGIKILLREANGKRLEQVINNSANPWPETQCARFDCFICKSRDTSKDKSVSCWVDNVCYDIKCIKCQQVGVTAIYSGESSRSGYTRGVSHQQDLASKKPGTPLIEHQVLHHPDLEMEPRDFKMRVRKSFQRPLQIS